MNLFDFVPQKFPRNTNKRLKPDTNHTHIPAYLPAVIWTMKYEPVNSLN